METLQRAFSGGEISGDLIMRADQAKYQMGLAEALNVFVRKGGGVSNRAGSEFLFKALVANARLIPFVFSDEQVYVLEVGYHAPHGGYVRVYNPNNPTATVSASAWNSGTAYKIDTYVSYSGALYRSVADSTNKPPSSEPTFWKVLQDSVYEISAPWVEVDIENLQFVQANDVITVTAKLHEPMDIKRYGDLDWRIDYTVGGSTWNNPRVATAHGSASGGPAGSKTRKYRVTGVDEETGQESLPMSSGWSLVGDVDNVIEGSVTKWVIDNGDRSKFTAGDKIVFAMIDSDAPFIDGSRTTWKNRVFGREYEVTAVGAVDSQGTGLSHIDFNLDSSSFPVLSYIGASSKVFVVYKTEIIRSSVDTPTEANPVTVTWGDGATAGVYYDGHAKFKTFYVYLEQSGKYGYIGVAGESKSFADKNYSPVMSDRHPEYVDPFPAGEHPRTVSYFQERRVFGNTASKPAGVFASRTGSFRDFSTSQPIQSDDSVRFQMASRKVNELRHILDIGALVLMTSDGEWVSGAPALSPTTIELKQQSYNGCSWVPPAIIDNTAIYVGVSGNSLRDLRYEIQSDGFTGKDLTVYAQHLFEGHRIVAMAYARNPHSLVYAIRDDGIMLVLSYLREHEVWGWTQYRTGAQADGFQEDAACGPTALYRDVVVVPVNGLDTAFIIVQRGNDYLVERTLQREVSTDDAYGEERFLDASVAIEAQGGVDPDSPWYGGTMQIDQIDTDGWTAGTVMQMASGGAGAYTFSAGDVGKIFKLTVGDHEVYALVVSYLDPATVEVTGDVDIEIPLRSVAVTTWVMTLQTVDRPAHFASATTVAAMLDGDVAADVDCTTGTLTLPVPAVRAYLGFAYYARITTLPIEEAQEVISNRKKRVVSAGIRIRNTRGLWVGIPGGTMREFKFPNAEAWNTNMPSFTGMADVPFPTTYTDDAQVRVEQRSPLPLEVLGIVPKFEVGR